MRRLGTLALGLLGACRFDAGGLGLAGDDAPADAAVPLADAPALLADAPGPPADAPAPPPDGSGVQHGYRRALTIDAARVAGPLQDFPVFVVLTDPALAAHAAASGSDLYFTAADGVTALDHELQRWDAASGRLEAWVRVPALSNGADTLIYLRYGDAASAVAPNPKGVWKSDFVAVWHLEQAPSSAAGVIVDSLGVRPGSTTGLGASDLVDAQLGRGLRFGGGNDQVTFDNPLAGATPHTISAWVQQGMTNDNDALVVLGNGACDQARWLHTRFDTGNVAAGFYCNDFTTTGFSVVGQGFVLLHWTFGGGKSRLYLDGALAAGPHDHLGNPNTMGATGRLGNAPAAFGANMGLHATVDEVRIATVERSAAWVATEYANQSDPTSFYAVGAETPVF